MKTALLKDFQKLEFTDIPKPEPKDNEALIKVYYTGICGSDVTIFKGEHPTAKPPVVLGHEFFGVIEKINSVDPTDLKVGDRVTADPIYGCGVCRACREGYPHVCKSLRIYGIHDNGGFAEYTTVRLANIIKVPDELPGELAALSEPFAVGVHAMKRCGFHPGQTLFVIGGGPIGIVIAMMAKKLGASRILISELSEIRIKMCRDFGFETINPKEVDPLEYALKVTDGDGFDVVFEVSGSKPGILLMTQACRVRGTLVPMCIAAPPVPFELGKVSFKEMTVIGDRVYTFEDFKEAVAMLPELDRMFDLKRMIGGIFPIEDAAKGIYMTINGESAGKILIESNKE